MTVELSTVRGPLDDEQLGWIVRLYGTVDESYASLDYVRHQFLGNPFGWSANVFALEDGRPVGHCGVVPFRARRGTEPFVAGKLEALAVEAAHRGRRPEDGGSLATDILSTLYPFAVDSGVRVLFGLAPPAVARVHARAGCHLVSPDAPAYTLLLDARAWGEQEPSRKRRWAAAGLGFAQRVALAGAGAAGFAAGGAAQVDLPRPDDAALAHGPASDGGWTVAAADAWDWYVGSGVLRAIEIGGAHGSRAIVRVTEGGGSLLQVVAWRPCRQGLRSALTFLAEAARLGARRGARSIRFQPWQDDEAEATLARACRLLGFVRRPEADLVVYPDGPAHDDVRLTPFFYVTF